MSCSLSGTMLGRKKFPLIKVGVNNRAEVDFFQTLSGCRVARWLSPKYWTRDGPVSLAQTIELSTHVLSDIIINIIPDKEPKHRTPSAVLRHRPARPGPRAPRNRGVPRSQRYIFLIL